MTLPFAPDMPPPAPLDRPVQRLKAPFADPTAPQLPRDGATPWRVLALVPALATTLGLAVVFHDWLRPGGVGALELVLIGLICLTFFWIAFSVSTATAGMIALLARAPLPPILSAGPGPALRVALLVPVYNESPADVFGNAAAMLADVKRLANGHHSFDIFFLSDTRDDKIAQDEARALRHLRRLHPDAGVFYRRRAMNTDRKSGNIADWVEGWGAAYEAMLVLDADSLMSADAIMTLADTLAADRHAGLVQTAPLVHGARSCFGRVQQFAGTAYGWVLAEGLGKWSGDAGNFWGHNAILRTRAFADCAGLPHMRDGRLILSHDFVEAALLRRAGWAVRFCPAIPSSYEEAPQTLIDYVLRDRRWCQGNLQHLRILGAAGLHPVSRFHMLQGAFSYLLSPAWFILLLFWALLGNGDASVIRYFDDANPMFPIWPTQSHVNGWLIIGFMYAMLLVPKAMGLIAAPLIGLRLHDYGGARRLMVSFVAELIASIAYAPVLMLQQMIAVLRSAIGLRETWTPQRRGVDPYPVAVLIRFHALETVVGVLLLTGMAFGVVSLWLIPIAASLALAVGLSRLSGFDLSAHPRLRHLMMTPQDVAPPQVIPAAARARADVAAALEQAKSPRRLAAR